MRRLAILGALATQAVACGADAPARAFVPGSDFSESVDARTSRGDSARVTVGEPLVLHARRVSGPWVEVDRDALSPDQCRWANAAEVEEEVAANLRWIVRPEGAAEFNTDFRGDLTREVRFREPGRYVLLAQSSGWCSEPYVGDSVVVEVIPP